MTLKFGRNPSARPFRFKFSDYIPTEALPTPPKTFGWDYLVQTWPLLANGPDPSVTINPLVAQYGVGDCVIACGYHDIELANAAAKKTVAVTADCALKTYAALTGYDPSQTADDGSNPTDQGTDMESAARWRMQHGFADADGNAHKIAAYLDLDPTADGFLNRLAAAVWLFGSVDLGVNITQATMDQFNNGQPWDASDDNNVLGGHGVPAVGRGPDGLWHIITWGAVQKATDAWITQNTQEAIITLTEEMMLAGGKNLDNFDWATLEADLKAFSEELHAEELPKVAKTVDDDHATF